MLGKMGLELELATWVDLGQGNSMLRGEEWCGRGLRYEGLLK